MNPRHVTIPQPPFFFAQKGKARLSAPAAARRPSAAPAGPWRPESHRLATSHGCHEPRLSIWEDFTSGNPEVHGALKTLKKEWCGLLKTIWITSEKMGHGPSLDPRKSLALWGEPKTPPWGAHNILTVEREHSDPEIRLFRELVPHFFDRSRMKSSKKNIPERGRSTGKPWPTLTFDGEHVVVS